MGVSLQFLTADGTAITLGQIYSAIFDWCKARHPDQDQSQTEKDAAGWNEVLEWAAIGNKTVAEWTQKDPDPIVRSLCDHLRATVGLVAFSAWR